MRRKVHEERKGGTLKWLQDEEIGMLDGEGTRGNERGVIIHGCVWTNRQSHARPHGGRANSRLATVWLNTPSTPPSCFSVYRMRLSA